MNHLSRWPAGHAHHTPDWGRAGHLLGEAVERYRRSRGLDPAHEASYGAVAVACTLPGGRSGAVASYKTVERDIHANAKAGIQHARIEGYAQGLFREGAWARETLERWLDYTDYPTPGELVACICDLGASTGPVYARRADLYARVRRNEIENRPPLYGGFLGRAEELARAVDWADDRRSPVAIFWGFGGNGKTTLLARVRDLFAFDPACPLRWPYDAVVWVSAKDSPGQQLTLPDVLRATAATLNPDEDRRALQRRNTGYVNGLAIELLRNKRVLTLIDNFETVDEGERREILEFYVDRERDSQSQALITSRYALDEVAPAKGIALPPARLRIEGLSTADALQLMQDYLAVAVNSAEAYAQHDLERLAALTGNNAKAILAVLGMVESGSATLAKTLDDLAAGTPALDHVYDRVIGHAWRTVLSPASRRLLLAKSFFTHPVGVGDLARVAGVDNHAATSAVAQLRAISFFDRAAPDDVRVTAHPLAQEFARRRASRAAGTRAHALLEKAEQTWWAVYARDTVMRARDCTYDDLGRDVALSDDIKNVLDRVESHLRNRTRRAPEAASLFAAREEQGGLGYVLEQLGEWQHALRVAEPAFNYAKELRDARMIRMCGLNLLSKIHRERHELDQATAWIDRVRREQLLLKDERLGAAILTAEAEVERRRGRFYQAHDLFKRALGVYERLGERRDEASTHLSLGGTLIDMASNNLGDMAYDPDYVARAEWRRAEEHFCVAEQLWVAFDPRDPGIRFDAVATAAWRGVSLRIAGDLEGAFRALDALTGQFQALTSVARLFRERALVEHLLGDKGTAREHDERGLAIERSMGLGEDALYHNCYKAIKRLKGEGGW